jgi:hypothetical protein
MSSESLEINELRVQLSELRSRIRSFVECLSVTDHKRRISLDTLAVLNIQSPFDRLVNRHSRAVPWADLSMAARARIKISDVADLEAFAREQDGFDTRPRRRKRRKPTMFDSDGPDPTFGGMIEPGSDDPLNENWQPW